MPESSRDQHKHGRDAWQYRLSENSRDDEPLNGHSDHALKESEGNLDTKHHHANRSSRERDVRDIADFRTSSASIDSVSSSQHAHPCIKHGQVWKLGRMWSVGSSFRLWRTRYLVVQDGYALLYTDERFWRTRQEPKCRVNLRGARVEKHIGACPWVKAAFILHLPRKLFHHIPFRPLSWCKCAFLLCPIVGDRYMYLKNAASCFMSYYVPTQVT
jgi:hypothetical protein